MNTKFIDQLMLIEVMKQYAYTFLVLISMGCLSNKNHHIDKNFSSAKHLAQASAFKTFKQYSIKDTINIDLNGDHILDIAYFKIIGNKKAIVIRDGKSKKEIKAGMDQSFRYIGDDFKWVNFWGITDYRETYAHIVKNGELMGSRKVKLQNKSIFVSDSNTGGGIITIKNHKLVWVHQAD